MGLSMKLKLLIMSFIFYAEFLDAGAVVRIDRIDLVNGKKIILFSEYHIGPITSSISSEDLARRQYRIFFELFSTFTPNKNNYAMYIENSVAVKEKNLEYYKNTQMSDLPGFASSWFDRLYLSDTHGFPEINWDYFAHLKNFDERTKTDWLLINVSHNFDRFYDEYKKREFNEDYFQSFKRRFFAHPDYIQLRELSKDYKRDFLIRLDELKNRLASKLTAQDFDRLNNMIEDRIKMYQFFLNALLKAGFMNKGYFEFLFEMAHLFKGDFYKNLAEILNLNEPLPAVTKIALFNSVIADLNLLDIILSDPHPVVLVSLGDSHSKFITSFLIGSPMTRSATFLDMLHPGMVQNLDAASPAVIQFVNQ